MELSSPMIDQNNNNNDNIMVAGKEDNDISVANNNVAADDDDAVTASLSHMVGDADTAANMTKDTTTTRDDATTAHNDTNINSNHGSVVADIIVNTSNDLHTEQQQQQRRRKVAAHLNDDNVGDNYDDQEQPDKGNNSNNDDDNDCYEYYENYINLALLHPNRYGWTASGDIADVSTPYYNNRRRRSSNNNRSTNNNNNINNSTCSSNINATKTTSRNEKHRKRSSTTTVVRKDTSQVATNCNNNMNSKKRSRPCTPEATATATTMTAITTIKEEESLHSIKNDQQQLEQPKTDGISSNTNCNQHQTTVTIGYNKRQTKKKFFDDMLPSKTTATTVEPAAAAATPINPYDDSNDTSDINNDDNNNPLLGKIYHPPISLDHKEDVENDNDHNDHDRLPTSNNGISTNADNVKILSPKKENIPNGLQEPLDDNVSQNHTATIDTLSYYKGREKWDIVNKEFTKNLKPMIVTITIDIPLCDEQTTTIHDTTSHHEHAPPVLCTDYYRETIQWNLSNMSVPNPILYASQIGEQFGLSYPMIWDIAHSIQMQIHDYINDHCSYVAPIHHDTANNASDLLSAEADTTGTEAVGVVHHDNNRNGNKSNAGITVPHLYGEVTGYLQQGGTCVPHVPRTRSLQLSTNDGKINTKTDNTTVSKVLKLRESSNSVTGRALSGSQRSISNSISTRQQSHGNPNRSKVKVESAVPSCSIRRRTVPKLPITEFPKEVSMGIDKDRGFEIDYQTLFTAEGSFLVTTDNNNSNNNTTTTITTTTTTAIAAATTAKDALECTPTSIAASQNMLQQQPITAVAEDGSVDFCNVCKTVGNLLCCDFCPRAFHCQCIPSDSIPESMNDESKWECPSCVQERNGLLSDNITETPMLNSLISVYKVDVDDATSVQHITVLSMLHEMLHILMEYDFGDVFRSPVNCDEIPTYKTIVKHPMDLGTIQNSLNKGRYERKSLEGVVLAVLKDIELVWHNCFIFNVEGSAVYRMANIHKRRAYSIRQRSFDHMISDRIKTELAEYIASLELERDNHRRLDALAIQSRSNNATTTKTAMALANPVPQTHHKVACPSNMNAKRRPVAVLDADSGRIMKIYTSMQAASTAVNHICSLKRHECEWETNEIDTLIKFRKTILMCNTDPDLRLFGYRWLCLHSLRNRSVAFANPKSKVQHEIFDVDSEAHVPDKHVKEEFVGLVCDGKSFFYHSIAEALSFPNIQENLTKLEEHLENMVSGADFETFDGKMWKRSEPEDFEKCGIEFVKEDVVVDGTAVVLCGFVDIVAAHTDWCHTLDASFTSPEDNRSLDVFSRFYLDQDRNVDGIRWRRIQPRPTEGLTNNNCDATINTSATSVSCGLRQDTSSTDTHSTADNSNTSRVYDVERVPSPKVSPSSARLRLTSSSKFTSFTGPKAYHNNNVDQGIESRLSQNENKNNNTADHKDVIYNIGSSEMNGVALYNNYEASRSNLPIMSPVARGKDMEVEQFDEYDAV